MPIGSVTIAPLADTVAQTGQIQLVATVLDSLGNVVSNPTLNWQSTNNSIATVTSSGLVTGVSPGTATITASDGGKSGTNTTVVNATVTSVHVAPALDTIFASAPGNTVQLIDSAFGSSGYLPGVAVTWSPTSGGVATVNANGLVTATNTADGSATITATSSSGPAGSGTVVVFGHSNTVTPGTPGSSTLSQGGADSTTDNAMVLDTFGTDVSAFRMVTWTSGDPTTVTVNGGASATVTAGTPVKFIAISQNSSPVTITVTAVDNASATNSISLTVGP